MKLGAKQELFSILLAQHVVWLYEQGYKVRMGDVFAHDGHKDNSNHYKKLAADLNLFKDGVYIVTTDGHAEFGEMWETRHDLCRWGGRFNDGNHYSLIDGGNM